MYAFMQLAITLAVILGGAYFATKFFGLDTDEILDAAKKKMK